MQSKKKTPGLVRNEKKVEAEFNNKDVMNSGWVEKNKVSDLFLGRYCKLLQCGHQPPPNICWLTWFPVGLTWIPVGLTWVHVGLTLV